MWSLWTRFAARATTSGGPGLAALSSDLPTNFVSARGFKVVSALRRRCRDCRLVRRGKKIYVLCEANPRHKQRQGKGGSRYQPC
jgi:large subunit ribosomal protein L36